jgi:uncharacterized protein (TIGR01777 family)
VLSRRGGALPRQLALFRLGLGGRLSSGRQYQSWISLDDEVGAICHLLGREDVAGPVNMTSPNPVTNREFTRVLAAALHRPALLPVPAPALRVALGREMADELLLTSTRAVPRRLSATGFEFEHPTLEVALSAVLQKRQA